MKKDTITCDVVQDLLPLYEDGCCSRQSGKIVEEHLEGCRECREKSRLYREGLPRADVEGEIDVKEIKRGIGRINRWKIRGIVSLCLALLLVFAALPAWNYVNGSGLTYANLKAAYVAFAFEKALVAGDYEKAYRYLGIGSHYNDLLATDTEAIALSAGEADAKAIAEGIEEIQEKGFDWYNEVCREKFMENMKTLEDMDESLCAYSDFAISRQPWGWIVRFDAQTSSGQDFLMQLNISPEGIEEIYPSVDSLYYESITGETIRNDEMEQKLRMLSRFYISPTKNETVMKILYENTDYDWTQLFSY